MRFVSWNAKRKSIDNVDIIPLLELNPNIIAFQELRPAYGKISDELSEDLSGYLQMWNNIGHGMAVFIRSIDLKMMSIDFDGRSMTFEFNDFIFVNVNAPQLLHFGTEDYIDWFKIFRRFLIKLNQIKPVVVGGTFNVISNSPDIPPEDARVMKNLLNINYVDTFNEVHPNEKEAYTYKIVGKDFDRRIDYFFVSGDLKAKIKNAAIEEDSLGSNHRPVTLEIEI